MRVDQGERGVAHCGEQKRNAEHSIEPRIFHFYAPPKDFDERMLAIRHKCVKKQRTRNGTARRFPHLESASTTNFPQKAAFFCAPVALSIYSKLGTLAFFKGWYLCWTHQKFQPRLMSELSCASCVYGL